MKSKNLSSSTVAKPTMSSLFMNDHQSMGQAKTKKAGLFNDEKEAQECKPITNNVNKSNPWNVDPFVPHYNKVSSGMFALNEEAAKIDENRTPPQRNSSQSKFYYSLS